MNYVKRLYYWILDYVYYLKSVFSSAARMVNAEDFKNSGGHPVIIIPGVYESWRFMLPIIRVLRLQGYDVHIIDGLGYNRGTIEDMAEVVLEYITTSSLGNVSLVTHSKGGLIGKFLLGMDSDAVLFDVLIALNTPFSGSIYAYALPFKSLRIFTPRSRMIQFLADNKVGNNRIVSIYGIFDPHIPKGSYLEGAQNRQIHSSYGHFRPVNNTRVHEAITDTLNTLAD